MRPKKQAIPRPQKRADPFGAPAYRRYAKHFFDNVAPQIRDSAYTITVAPHGTIADVKIATELGYSILLDKPLIVFVPLKGQPVAQKLLRIADHVIEGDSTTEAGREEMQRKLQAILTQ